MIMGGSIDAPQRSSSPLKRRASSMDQDMDSDSKEDVDMINPPPLEESGEEGDKGESRSRQSADQPGSPKSFTMKTGSSQALVKPRALDSAQLTLFLSHARRRPSLSRTDQNTRNTS